MSHTRHSFIHSVFCLTTGPKPPPKRCLHIVRSRASSFKWEYPLPSLRSSSSFLRLLPRLLATSISPFIFPSIACFRRQFLRKMWPIQFNYPYLLSILYINIFYRIYKTALVALQRRREGICENSVILLYFWFFMLGCVELLDKYIV